MKNVPLETDECELVYDLLYYWKDTHCSDSGERWNAEDFGGVEEFDAYKERWRVTESILKKLHEYEVGGSSVPSSINELRGALQKLGSIGGRKSAGALTAKERSERATKASHARKVWKDAHSE